MQATAQLLAKLASSASGVLADLTSPSAVVLSGMALVGCATGGELGRGWGGGGGGDGWGGWVGGWGAA